MMRELTDIERDYLIAYWFSGPLSNLIAMPERFKEGFIAALDYNAAQIAALTAERDALAQQLKIAEEVEIYLGEKLQEEKQLGANQREVNAHLARERKKAEAERDALRAALKPFVYLWRDSLLDNQPDLAPMHVFRDAVITAEHIRAARRVLGED